MEKWHGNGSEWGNIELECIMDTYQTKNLGTLYNSDSLQSAMLRWTSKNHTGQYYFIHNNIKTKVLKSLNGSTVQTSVHYSHTFKIL